MARTPDPADLERGQAQQLLDYLDEALQGGGPRRAVYIHLSRLSDQQRHLQHLQIATNSFDTLIQSVQGRLFGLANGDIVFIFPETALDEVQSAIVKLRFMFGDDPLIAGDRDGPDSEFVTWYDLARDANQLTAVVQGQAEEEKGRRSAAGRGSSNVPGEAEGPRRKPLTPGLLGQMESALAMADLTNMMRRQSVCAVVGNAAPQQIFSEIYVSIGDLRDQLLPNVDITANRWLFQHLTETLDQRVLALLNKRDEYTITGEISINLNINTLLSPEFLRFDENIRPSMRGSIVLELQPTDIFADLPTYLFARDFAHERGYRICVDGVMPRMLGLIDRVRLGADMVKVISHADLGTWAQQDAEAQARRLIQRIGPARMIVTRCDDADAVKAGQELGIQLFQGRHVERLLSEEERKREQRLVQQAKTKGKRTR